jgi:hypothetical protein
MDQSAKMTANQVWIVRTHPDGEMRLPLDFAAVVSSYAAGKRLVEARLHDPVRKRRVWRQVRPNYWECKWSRSPYAQTIATVALREVLP